MNLEFLLADLSPLNDALTALNAGIALKSDGAVVERGKRSNLYGLMQDFLRTHGELVAAMKRGDKEAAIVASYEVGLARGVLEARIKTAAAGGRGRGKKVQEDAAPGAEKLREIIERHRVNAGDHFKLEAALSEAKDKLGISLEAATARHYRQSKKSGGAS